jgi:hypothetical protein
MKGKLMTKSSPPARQTEEIAKSPTAPARTALFGGAALLILFAWLQLILALQIASTGRQIQVATEELSRLKRSNMAVVRDTAIVESEEKMSERAMAIGYGPQTPVYLSLGPAFAATGPVIDSRGAPDAAARIASNNQDSTLSEFLLDRTLYDTTTVLRQASSPEIGSDKSQP